MLPGAQVMKRPGLKVMAAGLAAGLQAFLCGHLLEEHICHRQLTA